MTDNKDETQGSHLSDTFVSQTSNDSETLGPCERPSTYPARCDVTVEELRELKDIYESDDNQLSRGCTDDWPPRDLAGNVYPIWFTPDELNDDGKLTDLNGSVYPPFSGNRDPIPGSDPSPRCNFPLGNWRDRYPNIRYCGQYCQAKCGGNDYHPNCYNHRNMSSKTAEEHLQSGMYTKTVDHMYDSLNPWKKLVGWGTFESLMGESTYEYGPEYEERELDFSEEPIVPDDCDEDGILTVKMGYPTDHGDRALSLYVAAMKTVQMISVQPQIMEENAAEGVGMMEAKTVESAQLTAPPSEHDPSPQQFKTLETVSEHHLNLPLSRLVTDRPKLLEYGGVLTDAEAESDNDIDADEIVLEIEAEPDEVQKEAEDPSDPNQFRELTAESERILESTND